MSEIKNITYNPEPEIIIKKYKEIHFDKNTEITVPKDCAAVLYFSGKVLDLLEEGSYLLTPENIPNTAKTLDIESEDGFDVGLCFVNKAETIAFDWESKNGKSGSAAVSVDDCSKFVSGLLAFTDLENTSVIEYIKKFVTGGAEQGEKISLSDIGAKGSIDVNAAVETVIETEPEIIETEPEMTVEAEPEPESEAIPETKEKKKKSPVLIVAVAAVIVGVAICLAVAIFAGPKDTDNKGDDNWQTVVDPTGPKEPIAEEDRVYVDIAKAQKGDYVKFGVYEQDADTENGAEPLGWEVIGVEDGNLVLTTERCIDCIPYNSTYVNISWEECSLRKWLNGEFYKKAFNETEQAQVVTTVNKNALDTNFDLENGKNTEDKVYLLSLMEVKSYFGGSELLRQIKATPYAVSKGIYVDEMVTGCCRWWLRSPGDTANTAAFVENDGFIANIGDGVISEIMGVRPVIRISVK